MGKVLKVVVVMRSLFIDRTIVKGYHENVYTEDGKVRLPGPRPSVGCPRTVLRGPRWGHRQCVVTAEMTTDLSVWGWTLYQKRCVPSACFFLQARRPSLDF